MGNEALLGVIGGVGPHAGLDFVRNIFNNTQAIRDQDHIGCMMISCPALIPDRTAFLLNKNGEENPALGLFESARRLYTAGVRYAAVACNTAHSAPIFTPFCTRVKESLPELTIVNMLETCAAHIRTLSGISRIGLLATKGTYQSRVYHEYIKKEEGFILIEPEGRGQEKIHEAIYSEEFGIKAHTSEIKVQAKNHIIYEIYRLVERGAEAVILGCTELPLAVSPGGFPVPILDPGLLTARALIALADRNKLLHLH